MVDTEHGIPYPEPAVPTPEHQQRITREKWFEIIVVVSLILGGMAFLTWRNSFAGTNGTDAQNLGDSGRAMVGLGAETTTSEDLHGLAFHSYVIPLQGFECRITLAGQHPDAPLDLAMVSLWPHAGIAVDESRNQTAVNRVLEIGYTLVGASVDALEKAVRTMEFQSDAPRPYDKGVAATNNGWKVTYITYREYDDDGPRQPVLCYVLQPLSSASEDEAATLYRTLFQAIHDGQDPIARLRETNAA